MDADRGSADPPLRTVTYSSMYPSAALPRNGLFVEQRLLQLLSSGQVETTVVSPVPWFPLKHPRFGGYARFARVARSERRDGVTVVHPRYPVIPKVGMGVAPWLMARATARAVRRVARESGPVGLIDAHYFYPDGVAAILLGRRLGIPVVITARGTDVNVIPRYRLPRRWIRWAARQAAGLIAVSEALGQRLQDLGIPSDRITVLRNGVDLDRFRPVDREAARARLGLRRRTLLSVGNLIAGKGHHFAVEALAALPETDLLIVGEGVMSGFLERQARELGLQDRVRLIGGVPHEQMPDCYRAADALVLASAREGMPNVVLESLACGTPVVATRVGGIPEVVRAPEAGVLMRERSGEALADAVKELSRRAPDRAETRRYAERFDWDETTRGQIDVFRRAVAAGPRWGRR